MHGTTATKAGLAQPVRRGTIEIRAVSQSYQSQRGSTPVLSGISLAIAPGSFVCVAGRSGCGKSTLLKLLAGLLRPTAGSILIDGAPVVGPTPAARYVFQDYSQSLLPWQTVIRNVAFGHRHGVTRHSDDSLKIAERYLAAVGLAAAAKRYPWELSGGMQQRVAIARALASQPSILLMDEPFSAVDALSREQLQDLVSEIWQETAITIVLVTHDIEEAIYLSDRVIVLSPHGDGIAADIAIDLPRPRRQVETRELADYLHYRRTLHRLVLA